jgi:hypothetical protein
VLAHQHFRAPGFLRDDRLIDAVVIVVLAADGVIKVHLFHIDS